MEGQVVARYHGVNVIKSCGYYYPEVNGNIEKKSIKEVKEWIENCWLFVMKNMDLVADNMGIERKVVRNFFINIM